MKLWRGSDGSRIDIDPNPIGGGGEGSIHRIMHPTQKSQAVKLYKVIPNQRKCSKIRIMVQVAPRVRSSIREAKIAWPTDTVINENGAITGVIIPLVRAGIPMAWIDNPIRRADQGLNFRFRDLVRLASEAAVCISRLHEIDIVVGDLHPGNFLVDMKLSLNLIDMDTVKFEYAGNAFSCDVNLPEYSAPEILCGGGHTKASDVFALGIIVHCIIMQGTHPYTGIFMDDNSQEINTVADKIRKGERPSGNHGRPVVIPEPARTLLTPPMPERIFGRELWTLCQNTFTLSPETRPNAVEYEAALSTYYRSLVQCPKNPQHASLPDRQCVWCEIRNHYDPFPRVRDANVVMMAAFSSIIASYRDAAVPTHVRPLRKRVDMFEQFGNMICDRRNTNG